MGGDNNNFIKVHFNKLALKIKFFGPFANNYTILTCRIVVN